VGFLASLSIANSSPPDRFAWAYWTARFCVIAWLLAGLPLAITDPDVCTLLRATAAVLLGGILGIGIVAGLFRSTNVFFAAPS
jgi:hypothetical protein